jgi:hypothetical protein
VTVGLACVQTLLKEALKPSKSVQHFASRGATFKKGAESHVSINMAVVLRAKINFISTRPDGLTEVHGSPQWY